MHALLRAFAIGFPAFALCSALAAAAAGQTPTAPYEINAILPLTGSSAFLGSKEAEALRVLEDVVNRSGGIRGRPVKFVIHDDATNPQISVQLTADLIAQKVPVVLGSSVSATCSAMKPLVEANGPLDYCYSPIVEPAPGSFEFSAAVNTKVFEPVQLAFFRRRGWNRIATLETVDVTGQDAERQLDEGLQSPAGRGLQLVAREHFQATDLSVAAQVARIKASKADVILTVATGPALGTVLRALFDAGVDVPIIGSGSNMTQAQMAQYVAFAPKELDFVSTSGAQPDPTARGARRNAQGAFFAAFKRAGIYPQYGHMLAWDPAMIVVDALRSIGPNATAPQLRDWIARQTSWAGNCGIYDFQKYPQRGLGINAAQIYRWVPSTNAFVTVPTPKLSQ